MELTYWALIFVTGFCFSFCALLLYINTVPEKESTKKAEKYRYYHGVDLSLCPPTLSIAQKCKWLMEQEPPEGRKKVVRDLAEANRVWLVYEHHFPSSG